MADNFFILLIGRKLSWGRVLFYQISVGENGPEFISGRELWFAPIISVLITVGIVALLIGIWRNNPIKYLPQVKLPLPDIIILFSAVIIASLMEKKGLPDFFHTNSLIFEEFAEVIVY